MSRAVELAYRKVRESIVGGDFEPGMRLKEEVLVALCGVSRTPVRTALSRLATDGLIEIEPNQGARVRRWSESEMEDLFGLRTLLEGHAAARAAQRMDDSVLQSISEAVQLTEVLLNSDERLEQRASRYLQLNHQLHSSIWHAAQIPRLAEILSSLVEQALDRRIVATFSVQRLQESHHHHQELVRAFAARDGDWAEAIMKNHIRAAWESLRHEQVQQDNG